jgi:hypothetical protein
MRNPKPPRRSLRDSLAAWWRRIRGKEPELPGDPFAYRSSPVRRGPNSRSGAVAVAEPDEEHGLYPPRKA